MAQPSKEQKLKELTDWIAAFGLSSKDASKQLKVTEEVLAQVLSGKAMPRPMWTELKSRFDYKQCFPNSQNTHKGTAETKQEKPAADKDIKVGKENSVFLQKTQMTFSFTAEISSLRVACKRWLAAHPGCPSKDLVGTVEAMLQDLFS